MLNQSPWTVRGCLLNLNPWPPGLTLAEIELDQSPWIHGILLQLMTMQNTTRIRHGLEMWIGKLLEIDGSDTP